VTDLKFPFTDLHSFKDYVGFVQMCSPDRFPLHEWAAPDAQWTLERAFEGMRYGLQLSIKEKGDLPVFAKCQKLVDDAHDHFKAGRRREGYFTLEEMRKLLRRVPSW